MGMEDARSTGSVSGIGTAYDLTKAIEIDLGYTPRTARFIAHVSLIKVQCSNLSSSAHPTISDKSSMFKSFFFCTSDKDISKNFRRCYW
jgi:hypothetical protein